MIYIHTGKVTDSKYCTFGSACFYLSDIPIRDIPYSFLLLRTLILPLSCNVVSHPDPAGWCKRLCSSPVDHSAFRPAIFCFLLEIPIHFIFHLHPKYTKSQSHRIPALVSRSGGFALCGRGLPFAQSTKILAKDGWAMLLWTHSVFRACGVSYASFLLSAAGYLIEYVHVYTLHKLPGVQPMATSQCSFAFWPGRVV